MVYPSFDEIVFEHRNHEYGAYVLRKKYNRNVTIALSIGLFCILAATLTPFIMATVSANYKNKQQREVVMEMEKIDKPQDAPPPEAPPPPPEEKQEVQQVKFTAPVVVDSVPPDTKMATVEETSETVEDESVLEIKEEIKEEVVEEEAPKEIFIIVEEMPEFPGGQESLMRFIAENVKYPQVAKENDIKGKVYVRFCVTYKGDVDQASVARGVDPLLDEEALRVVKMLPKWKPGKQRGKAVNVWYTVPINFVLQ